MEDKIKQARTGLRIQSTDWAATGGKKSNVVSLTHRVGSH